MSVRNLGPTHDRLDEFGGSFAAPDADVALATHEERKALAAALARFAQAVEGARRVGEDRDLKPEAVSRRQREIVASARAELAQAVDRMTQPLGRAVEAARLRREALARPTQSTDLRELVNVIRGGELRRELSALDGPDRAKAILDAARLGDRSLIDAAKGALRPLVLGETLARAEAVWFEGAHPSEAQAERDAEAIAGEVVRLARLALGPAPARIAAELAPLLGLSAEAAALDARTRATRGSLGLDPSARGWVPRVEGAHALPAPATAADTPGGEAA